MPLPSLSFEPTSPSVRNRLLLSLGASGQLVHESGAAPRLPVRVSTVAAADLDEQAYKLQAGEGFAALAKATALQLRHESSAMQPAPNVTVFYRGNAIGTISSTFIEHMVHLRILQLIKRCFYN